MPQPRKWFLLTNDSISGILIISRPIEQVQDINRVKTITCFIFIGICAGCENLYVCACIMIRVGIIVMMPFVRCVIAGIFCYGVTECRTYSQI